MSLYLCLTYHVPAISQVVLDLDETLVCAYSEAGVPESLRQLERLNQVRSFELYCLCDAPGVAGTAPTRTKIKVFERPGLHEFLSRLSGFAEIVLFTAGLEGPCPKLASSFTGLLSNLLHD